MGEEGEETESRESSAVRSLVDENYRNSRLISRATNFNKKDLTDDVDERKVYISESIYTYIYKVII